MKYLLLTSIVLFTGCDVSFKSAALCKSEGYKGVVSEVENNPSQYCSNGELINGKFLTDAGSISETYSLKDGTHTRVYIEFKETK
jgi:hypothetical protein